MVITLPKEEAAKGKLPVDMDEVSVNYLVTRIIPMATPSIAMNTRLM